MDETIVEPQEGMNPEPEVVEDTVVEETTETPEPAEETVPKSQFNQVLARAKKAEEENKKLKTPKQITNNQPALSAEQVHSDILKAQGRSQEEIDYLRKLAAVNGTSIIEAQKDELFVSYQAKKEAEAKAEKAKLGASRGSGSVKKEKSFTTPGITDQDHKELWKSQLGR